MLKKIKSNLVTMKFLITYILLLFATITHAQNINGIPITEVQSPYIEITIDECIDWRNINILVDYGQQRKRISRRELRLLNDSGKPYDFYSVANMLNFFDEYGYEFIQYYHPDFDGGPEHRYVLKRK